VQTSRLKIRRPTDQIPLNDGLTVVKGRRYFAEKNNNMNIEVLQNPLTSRARTNQPELIVLHATAGASAMSSINHLRNVGNSYHYIITRDGNDARYTREANNSEPIIYQCVGADREAFHTGSTVPAPGGLRINRSSIGISLANMQDGEAYPNRQLIALRELIDHLTDLFPDITHITSHATVQPWNRIDPVNVNMQNVARVHGLIYYQPTQQVLNQHNPNRQNAGVRR
jgi:N-acetyl-anhydromuramyl-L-alanine amidase AmpD